MSTRSYWLVTVAPRELEAGDVRARVVSRHTTRETAQREASKVEGYVVNGALDVGDLASLPDAIVEKIRDQSPA